MKHELIEISEMGEVSVLGVHIGMNRELAKRILTPEYRTDWQVSEFGQKTLSVKDYFKDKKIRINYTIENDVVKDIDISRYGTKDRKERDEALKYYIEKFKSLKIRSATSEQTILDTGLYNIEFVYPNPVFNDGQYYFIYIRIRETKYGDFVKKNFEERDFEDKNPTIGCLLTWAIIVCGAILLFNIINIFDFLGSVDGSVIFFIMVFVLFVVSVAYTVADRKRNHYFYKHRRLREEAVGFVRELKKHSELREKEILQDMRRYETSMKQKNDTWLKEQNDLFQLKHKQLSDEFQQKHKQLSDETARHRYEHNDKMNILVVKERTYENMVKNSLFKRSATMYADYKVLELDAVETYLRTKKSPIREGSSTAEVLKRLRQEKREDVARYKEMLYKWEFLLNVFPELGKYVDDDQELLDLADYEDVDDFQQNYDRVKDYVSDEEYRNLSVDERNQRALDNWRRRRKPSSAVAGMEYELYCAYLLREEGFNVIEHGVLNGRKDQGIDLIAQKPGITYIIQCKRYSTAFVHENTVCQLFGTTLNYTLANKEDWDKTLFGYTDDVIPILMTTGTLSDMANEYARRLGVVIRQEKMGIFPIIKCNINDGNKIYHLPFDQQYKRTIIEPEKGEFYAMTVKEATSAGFRRAFRYNLHANGNN